MSTNLNPKISDSASITAELTHFAALRELNEDKTASDSLKPPVQKSDDSSLKKQSSNNGPEKPKDIVHEEKKGIDFSSTKCTKPIMTEKEEAKYTKAFQRKLKTLENILAYFYTATDYQEVQDLLFSFEDGFASFCDDYNYVSDPLRSITLKVAATNYALKCVKNTPNKNDDLATQLNQFNNLEETDPEEHNADSLRIICLMKADLMIKRKNFKQAKELLQLCWDVPQKYFENKDEDYLDFYAAYKARIFIAEGNFNDAEKSLKEALALRIWKGNSRLISLSYSDLALFYLEKATKEDDSKVNISKAEEYLEKARDYDRNFMSKFQVKEDKLKRKDEDAKILFGQVDYRRADLVGVKKGFG